MAKKKAVKAEVVSTQETTEDQQFNSRLQECPIAIIGMASVFAEAKSLDQYWDNIVESVNAIIDIPASRWNVEDYYSENKSDPDKTYCKKGGFIPELDFDPMEFGLPPNILELTDIAQLLSLVVAREVLKDAGIGEGTGYDMDKVGITLGVGGGQKQISPLTSRLQGPVLEKVLAASGIDAEDRAMIIEKFKSAYIPWQENSFPGMLGNVIAGRIANRFDLGGTNCVVDAACAGSLAAIKLAVSDLLEYRSEVMISGGVCCDNSPFMYMSFSKTPAFTTGEDIRPFDNDSKGMMVGEGIGMMAFKRLEDAERDGDKVYAVLKGIGTSSDGRFKSIYAPRPDGQAKALKRAYDDAGIDPKTCGLIEGHGTGTMAGDAAEFAGLTMHFGADNDEKQHIALGSVKSQIGHTKSAAGAAGMIKAALSLHHKILPATINIDKPGEGLNIEDSPMYINSQTRPWMPREDGAPRRAGVSSFGFGGTNYHIVLEEYKPTQTGKYRLNHTAETIIIAAGDEKAVIAELQNWKQKLSVADDDDQQLIFNALITQCGLKTPAADQARCGFVAKNGNDALDMIEGALKKFTKDAGADAWSVPTGIYYRASGIDAKGKVVALFSGQGSQYVNMGSDVTCNFPSIMQTSAEMDAEFSQAGLGQLSTVTYPIPVYNKADKTAQEEHLRLTQHAQPAIGTFSVGLYKTFEQAGFSADFTAGHSFGELTALWAAGVLSDADYMMLARSRGQAMAAPDDADFDAGTMIAVLGEPAKVAEDIKAIKDISIANYNSNSQVVVAGVTSQVMVAFDELKAKGYKVVKLPVSAAFHTPLVGHAQKPFAKAIDAATFNAPKIPVFSNGTGKVHSNKAADIKKSMKNHILESVHFNDEVDNIYADGGRVFIEFGPKNVLTKLVENILKDKDDVTAIAVNANPKKSADVQMRQAAVQMAVLGLELNSIDPYSALERPLEAKKKSPMAMKLSAASYVSDKTRKVFEDALTDGWKVKQAKAVSQPVAVPEPKVIEKIVEKVVEKIVYVASDDPRLIGGSVAAPVAAPAASSSNADVAASIEQSVGQFVAHQQQLLNVHEQYMQGPQDYAKTFQNVLGAQAGNTELPASVDRTLAMYHEFQSETLRVHEQYLNNQTGNMAEMLSQSETPKARIIDAEVVKAAVQVAAPKPVVAPAPVHAPAPVQTVATAAAPAAAVLKAPVAAPAPVVAPAPVAAPAATLNVAKIQAVMLDVVAEKTGYPTEMLELGMDMEADLGIDSIKRVEILGAVQETLPALPELNPEDLAELRTLGEIVDYMQSKVAATPAAPTLTVVPTTAAAPAVDLAHIQKVMLDVVADKTGYPSEMLELGMDMEADLGIDSIKRVEILGAVQETIPDLPELNPEDLAELRTLGQIVEYMQSKVSGSAPATTETPVVDHGFFAESLMLVVAEKTGYPVEMLELEMDMEADLGIDSIKRVEILGAVQDAIEGLPEVDPETLAEMRTLGQIVDAFASTAASAGGAVAAAVNDTAAVTSTDVTAFEPAPSATVAIQRLNDIVKIDQDAKNANALIVDDGTGAAVKLADTLIKSGWNVTALKPAWIQASAKKSFSKAVNVVELETADEEKLKRVLAVQDQLDAVIYLQAKSTIDGIEYPEASKQGLMLAFLLAKLCNVSAAETARSSFVVVTRQGGSFGIADNDTSSDLVQGGLAGLVKTLSHEWTNVFCRIVDVQAKLSADKVATIAAEELLDADTATTEVGYDKAGRLTLVGELTDSYALETGNSIDSNSVFLVSGGAKGVTAHCVIRLAKEFNAKFILLGRSSFDDNEPTWANGINDEVELKKAAMQALIAAGDKPTPVKVTQFVRPVLANREIADTLNAIKSAGGKAAYVSADVTDSDAVQTAVKPHVAEFGAITGLIHGAGVLADKFIEQKTLEDFNAVYSTKMDGFMSMLACVDVNDIKHVVMFSSAAGFYGNPGQSDYSIANDILNKTAYRFKALHPKAQVLSFNWGPWDGGMVTPELKRMFTQRGVYIIPLDAGAELMMKELSATTNRSPQILVGNDMGGEDEAASVKKPEVSRLVKSVQAANNAFLADHVIGGNEVLPTVTAIAWMAAAAEAQYSGYHYQGLENYKLFKGIVFDGTEPSNVFIDMKPMKAKGDELKLDTKVSSLNAAGKPVFHYGGELILVRKPKAVKSFDGSLPALNSDTQSEAAKALYNDGTLFHGESLQGIQDVISCDATGLLLACKVPAIATEKQGTVPVALHNIFANDLVYQAMLVWVRKQLGLGSLPSATKAWTVYKEVPVNVDFYLQLKVVEQQGSKLLADIALIAADGDIFAEVSSAEVTASDSLNDLFKK
ncbi:MAG: SDR family oxidoreductase [Pseudomonadales bacterium]|nr:SDR family oxidoreductase [Pseudomonadales bacterium]